MKRWIFICITCGFTASIPIWAAPVRSPIAEQARDEKKIELLEKFADRIDPRELGQVRDELIADFKSLLDLEFSDSNDLQNSTFGFPADGIAYAEWFLNRVFFMRAGRSSDCSRYGAIATASNRGLWFCQGYFGREIMSRLSRVNRLSFLLHEAHHADPGDPNLHISCHYDKDLSDSLPRSEFYLGACDQHLDGAYAYQTAFLSNVATYCVNCDRQDHRNALSLSFIFAGRLLSPRLRQQLQDEYFGDLALSKAIENDDLAKARQLIESGLDPRSPRLLQNNLKPAYYHTQSAAMVDLLKELSPDLDWQQRWKDTIAFRSGIETAVISYDRKKRAVVCNRGVFVRLVEHGVNPLQRERLDDGTFHQSILMDTMEYCPKLALEAIRIIENQQGSPLYFADLEIQPEEVSKVVVQCTHSLDARTLLLQLMKRGMELESILASIDKGIQENESCQNSYFARAPIVHLKATLQQILISRKLSAAHRRLFGIDDGKDQRSHLSKGAPVETVTQSDSQPSKLPFQKRGT